MFPIFDIFSLIIKQLIYSFTDPVFTLLFLAVVTVVALQYRRMQREKQRIFKINYGQWWHDALLATAFGFIGGIIGSMLMVFVGLTLSGAGLGYLWPLAILLMLIDARFICFAYAGGIVALSSLIFGWPDISVPQVLALIAILHIIESLLILFSGHMGALPAYIKVSRQKIIGGFVLQRFWPIPVLVLVVIGYMSNPAEGISMPDWWPLIKPDVAGDPEMLLYALFPVLAGLGYGDIATARTPQEKSRSSAKYLATYSIILLILAVWADYSYVAAVIAALFSPLGHEAVININKRIELANQPIYVPPDDGVKVLDVVPGTAAWKAGIRSGDVILTVNGMPVSNRATLEFYLKDTTNIIEISYISAKEQKYCREHLNITPGRPSGIITVPEGNEGYTVSVTTEGILKRYLKKLKKR